MNKQEYKKLVKKLTPKENKLANMLIAFLAGGLVGFLGEIFVQILINCYSLERDIASVWLCIFTIFIGSLFTALNFFDKWVEKAKMGLILPTTGFAHSITSSALDYKKDGAITLGSNFFKLAGSVILYGMVSAFLLALLKVIIYG
jgi:stage V sporulation protein AC